MNTYIEQLMQIFNGAVWNGDLISEQERNKLVADGLVERVAEYNIITAPGVIISLASEHPDAPPEPYILSIARIAANRFGGSDGMFNSANFAHVVRDVFGLPLLDGKVVNLVLSDRPEIERLMIGSHWKLHGD